MTINTGSAATVLKFNAAKPLNDYGHVLTLVALGYLVLGMLALGWVALCAEALMDFYSFNLIGCLFCIPAYWLLALLRGVCTPAPLPGGVLIRPQDGKELFRFIDRVGARLGAPEIDVVCITADCNAAMAQSWRFGIVGRRQNCLVIGLTLMKTLTEDQFEAVVAHEVAHLSGKHARINRLVIRLQLAFARLDATVLRFPKGMIRPLRYLLRSYTTALRTAVLSFSKRWELEADKASVRLTSSHSAAHALIASQILKSYLVEKYWPRVIGAAKDLAEPAAFPYTNFDVSALTEIDGDRARWQRAALAMATSPADTHPCLRERLQAIGESSEYRSPERGQTAELLLGNHLCDVANLLDVDWRRRILEQWRVLHQNVQKEKRQLLELREAALTSVLDEQRSLLHANLEEHVGFGAAISLNMRVALSERFPQSLSVQYALGQQLLQTGKSDGVAMIEGVIAKDSNALLSGANLLRNYYRQLGQESLANLWQQRHALGVAAQQERRSILPSDQVGSHHLQGEPLARLSKQLESIPDLQSAYLVTKRVQHLPQFPLFVLGFTSTGFCKPYNPDRAKLVAQAIRTRVTFSGTLLIMNIDGENSRFAAKFRRIRGAQVA